MVQQQQLVGHCASLNYSLWTKVRSVNDNSSSVLAKNVIPIIRHLKAI